ncbi:uncharacterized protein SOCE26_059770 [Sorangium cellulosum]|uniref:Uncharacterized protein n=1 Tax=Sorangium cellulosum TaxID=56 RepID=A0A2L0EYY9_SORCE|nr:hypothetical protein [Sorangium cellulosum]AUX44513.1 uncharacterized protein SOCE26_059770 [Sorangium cellulosum]
MLLALAQRRKEVIPLLGGSLLALAQRRKEVIPLLGGSLELLDPLSQALVLGDQISLSDDDSVI